MGKETIPVAVYGASGFVGAELVRLLQAHPVFSLAFVAAGQAAGKRLGEVLPGVASSAADLVLASGEDDPPPEVQLAFLALPHAASAKTAARLLARGVRVIDLSADFRHPDPDEYARVYGSAHPHPELLAKAVYGLSEHVRERLAGAALIANPGCYPTASLLALVPLLRADAIDAERVIIDAISGISGAGRTARQELGFAEANESARAYGLPRHRHNDEIDTQASLLSGKRLRARFVPHVVPMTRGMLATIHLEGDARSWRAILAQAYRDAPFVRVLPEGRLAQTKAVAGSNRCDLAVVELDARRGVVLSAIDNLLKGAAGQAVQNANLAFGLAEDAGLARDAVWP